LFFGLANTILFLFIACLNVGNDFKTIFKVVKIIYFLIVKFCRTSGFEFFTSSKGDK